MRSPPTLAPGTELVAVGASACIFRPDTHAAALLNSSAAAVAIAMMRDGSLTGPAARLGNGLDDKQRECLLADLGAGGFLASGPQRPVADARLVCELGEPPINPAWWQSSFCTGCGLAYLLACEDAGLARLLAAGLAPLRLPVGSPSDGHILVSGSPGKMCVWRDGVRIVGGLSLSDARRVAIQALIMALLPADRVATLLHASAVAWDDVGILLAGSTGSGKTTLTLALVASGARYLADDLAPLDRSGRLVSPFPVAASVKHGSWLLLAAAFPALPDVDTHRVGDRVVRYLDPSRGAPPQVATTMSPRLLVFPHYSESRGVLVSRISPEDALSRLLRSGTEIVGAPRSIRPLARLVEEATCIELAYSDLTAAVDALREVAGR